jgi:hypothetical protein
MIHRFQKPLARHAALLGQDEDTGIREASRT